MVDINECSTNNGGCSANAQCTNVVGGTRTCTCNTGYTGDGINCTGEKLMVSTPRVVEEPVYNYY